MTLWVSLTRRKRNEDDNSKSKLARVLTLFDLTALGVGSTLGLGVYVLAGSVAYNEAGPAVTISFLIAAIASAFAALCYAEFAARVPKAGSAYVYTYVSVGEFLAFTIGWNLILEYIIGTSSVARGLSGYLDALIGNPMQRFQKELMPIHVSFLASYPDFFSFIIVMLVSILLAVGVKESSLLNNIFTVINLCTVVMVIVTGIMKADPSNWSIPKESIPESVRENRGGGEGGFMPFGIAGIMAGAAKCFFGFVGFDCVATTGEEAKNPQRNIPLSIVISLIIIFFSYFGVSTVLTMMWPYYLQDPDAPFPHVYGAIGWYEIKWIVSIGAVFALCTSLLGAMFPLPRVLYAMAQDGMLYKILHRVHPKTQTPVIATILSGLFAAVMALLFNLHQLVDMMSIGTLLAYTIVAICVVVLRYQCVPDSTSKEVEVTASQIFRQIINTNLIKQPTRLSSTISKSTVVIFCMFSVIACTLLNAVDISSTIWIVCMAVTLTVLLLLILILYRQPNAEIDLAFKVPLVPFLPCLSIIINLYLMFQLDINTWIRFVVWIIIGYLIYFTYGIRHSIEGKQRKSEEANSIPNNAHSLQNVNMEFVNVSTLALTDNHSKNSKF